MTTNSILLRGWRDELIAAGRAHGTITVRIGYVRRFLNATPKPLDNITRQDLITWMASHEDWSKDTRRSCTASMRGFWEWAKRAGYVCESPAGDLPSVGRKRPVPNPAADFHVMDAMRQAPEWVALAIEIMATCGLRRFEVAHLKDSDVRAEGQGWTITVSGKGDVTRVVPCPPHLAIRLRKRKGWIFPGGQGGHVSPGWLGKMISRHLPEGVTAHKLRHRFASVSYSHTRDLRALQELLGHASLATTQVYVRVSTEDTREAAEAAWKIAA